MACRMASVNAWTGPARQSHVIEGALQLPGANRGDPLSRNVRRGCVAAGLLARTNRSRLMVAYVVPGA